MRWSLINIARASPRLLSSRAVVSASAPGAFGLLDRQRHLKLRAARLRLDRDLTLVVEDETADDIETEPRSQARRLGCKEGIEDPVSDLGRNAGPVVGNPDDHPAGLAARHPLDTA